MTPAQVKIVSNVAMRLPALLLAKREISSTFENVQMGDTLPVQTGLEDLNFYATGVHQSKLQTLSFTLKHIYILQSDPDLPGTDLPEPRFTGRIIFPRNSKLTIFYPDIPGTPIYRAKPFPPSIPVNRGPTVSDPDLPGKTLSPEHPGKSVSDWIICYSHYPYFVLKLVGLRRLKYFFDDFEIILILCSCQANALTTILMRSARIGSSQCSNMNMTVLKSST
eukprot:sb/3469764/